jgi:hypothetical protein
MKKRVLVVLALLGTLLPVGGIFQSATAGSGSANSCTDGPDWWGHMEIPLITSPITLALEIPTTLDGSPVRHAYLCYSTSPAGYSGQDIAGGRIEVRNTWWVPGDNPQVHCTPQSNPSTLAPSCYAGTTPTYWLTTGTSYWGEENKQTLGFSVPITFCLTSCATVTPGLGTTGVIHGMWNVYETTDALNDGDALDGTHALSDAPPGTTGAGLRGVLLWYCANGSCQPLSSPLDLSAGAAVGSNPTNVTTGVWNGSDAGPAGTDIGGTATVGTPSVTACANGTCPTVSSVVAPTVGAGANTPWRTSECYSFFGLWCDQGYYYPAGEPVAAVQVGGTVIPVAGPPGCYSLTPQPLCQ